MVRWVQQTYGDAVWQQWAGGARISAIARAVGVSPRAIRKRLERLGGIPPPVRTRAPRVLRSDEREVISRGLAAGRSVRQIARQLQRAPSTVSREVRRHGGRAAYRASSLCHTPKAAAPLPARTRSISCARWPATCCIRS